MLPCALLKLKTAVGLEVQCDKVAFCVVGSGVTFTATSAVAGHAEFGEKTCMV